MSSPQPSEDLEAVPGFAPADQDLALEDLEIPSLSTASNRPSPPQSPSEHSPPETTSSTSSRASTARSDAAVEIDRTIVELFAGLAHLAGILANKIVRARTHTDTRLWLMTDEEAQGLGEPLGRMSARRVPDQLVDGDGGDLLEAGAVALGYAMHNAVGISGADLEARRRGDVIDVPSAPVAPPPAPAPPPPAPAAAAPEQPTVVAVATHPVEGVTRAEPPPPSVIPIDI